MQNPARGHLRAAHGLAVLMLLWSLCLAPMAGVAPPSAYAQSAIPTPILTRAVPGTDNTSIEGRISGPASSVFIIEFFASTACNPSPTERIALGSTTVTTNAAGNAGILVSLPVVIAQQFVLARALDAAGSASALSQCIPAGPGNDSWTRATPLQLGGDASARTATIDQILDKQGQSRWFRFSVNPGSRVLVTLSNLPAQYDLAVYKDIAGAYDSLTTPQDLVRLGAEFAPDAYSPDAYSPDAYSPDAYSPDAYSPDAYSPDAYSPDAYSPDAYSPDAYSPDAYSPDAYSPDAYSPDAYSPDAYSPDAYSPDAYSPDPQAYSSAQQRSLLGVSAFEGTAGQGLSLNTWNNTGDFYVRVRGRNGAFNPEAPFRLTVTLVAGACGSVNPELPGTSIIPTAGGYKSIILTDLNRMGGTPAERTALENRLAALAARPEVVGVIVDLSADARVAAANAQADALATCPVAKNLVAESIKQVVDGYWAINPLEYVVIIGNDDAIPFFRYPDGAAIGMEQNYVPPVRDNTSSQASLRLGYVLGQDAYGARLDIAFKSSTLPIAELAVGRLVETPTDVTGMIDAYLSTPQGVVPTPSTALITGYDFLEDVALEVQNELERGLGTDADTLIADRDWSPEDRRAWNAGQLREALLGERHDLMFLAGHFSANSALAADYTTRLQASEVAASAVDLKNSIIFSPGCHSGYNIVTPHGIPNVTREPDWAQVFNRKQATLIAGTGYQYGDTDFVYYSERLYLEFSRQLRTGTGPIPIGKALAAAKHAYLAESAPTRGIFEKSYLVATLFGLPMLSVDMPGARLTPTSESSIVGETSGFERNPGQTLGLTAANITITPSFAWNSVPLSGVGAGEPDTVANYLSGGNGVLSGPDEPVLPLELRNVDAHETVLRGAGFRGGHYTDLPHVLPLTGSATTEARALRGPFFSDIFYPVRPWNVNYLDELADSAHGATRLAITPAQYISEAPGSRTGTLRAFLSLDFKLYYSNNTTTYHESGNTPALAAPPAIPRIESYSDHDGNIHFRVRVTGDPAAGIQDVWVTYTATDGPEYGTWASLDLHQNPDDTTLWEGVLDCGVDPHKLRYMVQAANGVGLVSLMTNQGAYYTPDLNPGSPPMASQQPTVLTLDTPHTPVEYGTPATFVATLKSGGHPLVGKPVVFGLGSQRRQALTDQYGRAKVTMLPLGLPGHYDLMASFAPTLDYQGSSANGSLTEVKQATTLALSPASANVQPGTDSGVIATLQGFAQRPLGQQTIFFIVICTTDPSDHYSTTEITDYAGRARLRELPATLPAGDYTVYAYFLGTIPLPEGPTTLEDVRYLPANAVSSIHISSSSGAPGHSSPPSPGADIIAPVTSASVQGTPRPNCAAGCYSGSVQVTLTTSEPATTYYRIKPAGGSFGAVQIYSGPFVLSSEGANTVEFVSIDQSGNIETTHSTTVIISNAPTSAVLDTFGQNANLGQQWLGSKSGYTVASNTLTVLQGGPIYWNSTFGTNQEAFVTLADGEGASQALLLKIQNNNWQNGTILVAYDKTPQTISIMSYTPGTGWQTLAQFNNQHFNAGDQFSAQARANGEIRVYVNCVLIGTAKAPAFANKNGAIGLWYHGGPGATLDTFGGGSLSP